MARGGRKTLIDRIDPNIEFPILELLIDDVIPDPENYRRSPARKSLEDLISSVSKVGLLQPIIVEKLNGAHKIIGGHRRYFASLAAGRGTVLAKVFPRMTKELRQKIQIAENSNKKRIPQHDIAHNYWDFYKYLLMYESQGGIGEEELEPFESYWDLPGGYRKIYPLSRFAERLNKSSSTVRDAFRFQRLHSNIKRLVEKGELAYSTAVELARVEKKTQQLMMLRNQLARKGGYVRSATARKVVSKYLGSLGDDTGAGLGVLFGGTDTAERPKMPARADVITELNHGIRFMRTFMRIMRIDPKVRDYRHDRKSAYTIIYSQNRSIESLNSRLAEESAFYSRLCSRKPRECVTFLERILNGDTRKNSKGQDFLRGQKVKRIPISKIVPDPGQPRREMRAFRPLEELAGYPGIVEMAESMKDIGQCTPILLRPVRFSSGPKRGRIKKYMLVEGHRRTNGARLAELKFMQAYVLDLDDIEARLIQYESDVHEQDVLRERAERIYNLFQMKKKKREREMRKAGDKRYNYTVAEFAREQVGISVDTVRSLLEYHDLDIQTKSMYEEGLLPRMDTTLFLGKIPRKQRFFYALYAVLHSSTKKELETMYRANTDFEDSNLFKSSMSERGYKKWLRDRAAEVEEQIKREFLKNLAHSITLYKSINHLMVNGAGKLLYKDETVLQKIFIFYQTYQQLKGEVRKKRA